MFNRIKSLFSYVAQLFRDLTDEVVFSESISFLGDGVTVTNYGNEVTVKILDGRPEAQNLDDSAGPVGEQVVNTFSASGITTNEASDTEIVGRLVLAEIVTKAFIDIAQVRKLDENLWVGQVPGIVEFKDLLVVGQDPVEVANELEYEIETYIHGEIVGPFCGDDY